MKFLNRILSLLLFSTLLISSLSHAKNAELSTTLYNGLKVIIREDHRAPLAMMQVWYNVGGADEPEHLLGISHALEHMMFKGTIRVPNDEIKRINAQYGGSLNAYTSNNYTYYYQFFPKDYLNLALELEADRMSNLYLRQQDFATEIKVVMEERRQRTDDNPQALAFEKFRYLAYPTSPYRNPVIGPMSSIEQLGLNDLQSWYNTWYTPNNAIVVIVGDVDAKQTLLQVQRFFGDIAKKNLPTQPDLNEQINTGYRHLDEYSRIQVPNLYMAWNVPSLVTASQSQQAYALSLLKNILDGSISSRLNSELVRKEKILTTVNVNYDMINRGDTLFSITAIPAAKTSLAEAQAAIEKVINQLKTELVSPEELQRVQSATLSQLIFSQDTLQGQAQLIGRLEVNGINHQIINQFPILYDNISAQDIQNVVQQYLNRDNLATLYLQSEDKKPKPKETEVAEPPVAAEDIQEINP
ncbi:pitrilysin family protein [Acinetobacter puyangensis]|uniref:Zinc protease n=1 Tax=Acinetobacter puyangensis TaxID=1096779 RepID=A0A240EAR4_9GAMM|nr:pitrilysin family protein [Acinetobacter puyangensis]SNX45641.1 zinc protease [Acinetobacter puyangensis]